MAFENIQYRANSVTLVNVDDDCVHEFKSNGTKGTDGESEIIDQKLKEKPKSFCVNTKNSDISNKSVYRIFIFIIVKMPI